MNYPEVSQRWQTFLETAKQQFDQTMEQAQQGCAMLLDLSELDVIPMTNAWTGIENKVHEITHKIADTWGDKVEDLLDELEVDQKIMNTEYQYGQDLLAYMEKTRIDTEIDIFAEAAEKLYLSAKDILEKEYHCRQCQAQLTISNQFFRSLHIACPYCDKVNTFDPGSRVRSVENFCCHHLSQRKSRPLLHALNAAEQKMRDNDFQDYQLIKDTEVALKRYNEQYLTARIEIVPELQNDYEKDLQGKMAWFYDEVSRSPVWLERNPK